MCGICGVIGPEPGAWSAGAAAAMMGRLGHRGPDASGLHHEEGLALGHHRLSIVDLSDNGAQPMTLRPGGPTIVHNGEIYNFRELHAELRGRGHEFRGHSDTEVILRAYDEWGVDGLRRLEGIFAFGIWDPARARLLLIRDRLGVKPLYYALVGERLVFGSELSAVVAAGGMDLAIDPQALSEYLWFGNSYEDRTIYRGVRSLLPGHRLVREDGRSRIEPWWRMEEWLARPAGCDADPEEAVRGALDAAVARQLVADVPVGLFLSGGIDSSAIAASAMAMRDAPIESFAVGFDFAGGVDELGKARAVADHLGLSHREMRVSGEDLVDVLAALARVHGEPFADAANIPLYLLARALGGEIKVVLQGDGGDEMFAGYRRYSLLARSGGIPRPLLAAAGATAARLPGSLASRGGRIADALGQRNPAVAMALLLTIETLRDPPTALLRRERREALDEQTDPFLAYRRSAERFHGFEPVQRMLLTDLTLQLPSQFLPKVDRATMAHGIEARVPFLDEVVGRVAVPMSPSLKVRGGHGKAVLRDAVRDRLPAGILDAPKTGFGVPYRHWIRGPLHSHARDMVLSSSVVREVGFDAAAVEAAFDDHRSGRRDRGFLLWKLFQLGLWGEVSR